MKYYVYPLLIAGTFALLINSQSMSLADISMYVSALPEDVSEEASESWLDPDYSLFYRRLFNTPSQSALVNMLYQIVAQPVSPLARREYISNAIAEFNSLDYRKYKQDKDDVVYDELRVLPGDELVIFGDLHGALHSFIRTLNRFKSAGYIDELMKLIKRNVYFVFLGDYINRSPYGFPLLGVLLRFAARNPGRVFLLRGKQESDGYWESFSASREYLRQLYCVAGEAVLPLTVELNNIFIRLPDALVITQKNTEEILVCAHNKLPKGTVAQPATQAFLLGEDRRGKWLNSGLIFQEFLAGSAAWHLFSAPVELYRDHGGLTEDAWCTIPVGDSLAHNLIAYHHALHPEKGANDLLSTASLVNTDFYSLAYGQRVLREDDRAILTRSRPYFICSSGDLTATLRTVAQGSKQGVEACLLDANQHGGVGDYLFRLVFLDDQYIPVKMSENVRLLRERYHTNSLLFPQGSAPLQELMPLIKKGDFFVFFPYTGSASLRTPDLTSIIHMRQQYFDEVERLVNHFQSLYDSKKIALVFQDDPFGRPIAEHILHYLYSNFPGITVELVPFARGQLSMDQQIAQLKKFNPESIGFFITNPAQISTIITDLGINTFVGKHIFALAFEEFFVDVANRWGVRAMFSSSFQPPRVKQGVLMKEFSTLMSRYHYAPNIPAYESFVGMKLFLHAMKEVTHPITTEKIMRKIESFSGTNFNGLPLVFDPAIRGFSLPIWIFEEDGTVSMVDPQGRSVSNNGMEHT